MSLILTTIQQERQRIAYMLKRYQAELAALPKGTLSEKRVDGRTYHYLKHREGKRVVSRYIKAEEVDALRERLQQRKHIETMIKSLREELRIADKALEGKA